MLSLSLPRSQPVQRPQVFAQLRRTEPLWHLPLLNFLAHLRRAQRPGVSRQGEVDCVEPGAPAPTGAWTMWQTDMPPSQPIVLRIGLQTLHGYAQPCRASTFMHMKVYSCDMTLAPCS